MNERDVVLRLDRRRALVFFEFRTRFGDGGRLSIEHQAEQRVLWDLCADLERDLVEPLRPDYDVLLRNARQHVADDQTPRGRP